MINTPPMSAASSSSKRRDGIVLIAVWLVLSVSALAVAKQNLSVPGLYYDEAVLASLAKDFVTGVIIPKIPRVVDLVKGQSSMGARELSEKLHTLIVMYDGSYFHRLMNIGGIFEKMYDQPAGVHGLLGFILALAIIVAAIFVRERNLVR